MTHQLSKTFFVIGIAIITTGGMASHLLSQDRPKADTAATSDAGRPELDEATDLKLAAENLEALSKVINLAERAIEKGLDTENLKFAKRLIASSAMQRAEIAAKDIAQGKLGGPQIRRIRTVILADLDKAIKNDPKLIEAYVLMAQMRIIGQEKDEAIKALNQAIASGADDHAAISKVYFIRAQFQSSLADQLKDLQLSVETDPTNQNSWKAQTELLNENDRFSEGYEVTQRWLIQDETNVDAIASAYQFLARLERLDDAEKLLSAKIKLLPNKGDLYRFRGQIYTLQDKNDLALADFTRANELNPKDALSLLNSAQLHLHGKDADVELARKEVDSALKLQPGLVFGLLLRSQIAARQQRYSEAIQDLQTLIREQPTNPDLLISLGRLFLADNRHHQAITAADQVIKLNRENWQAFQIRADAHLGLGEHAKAIQDYQSAIDIGPDKDNRGDLLNNFAWLLATSTHDELRDGARSIKLGIEACELTGYKRPHILSTLAAGYAETGDFETAIKWSSKAVELGKEIKEEKGDEQLVEQLQKELESYQQKKPWREVQESKEKSAPIVPAGNGVDT